MPEGTPVEGTARVLAGLAGIVRQVPEVTDYQAYAGTAAPINFNGLVRQYYLRGDANQGDLQVNLVDKSDRSRKSHEIARAIRPALAAEGKRLGAASVQVVEVPPGPPGPGAARRGNLRPDLRRPGEDRTRTAIDVRRDQGHRRHRRHLERARARASSSRWTAPKRRCSASRRQQVADALGDRTRRSGRHVHPCGARTRSDRRAARIGRRRTSAASIKRSPSPLRSTSGALVPLSEVVTVSQAPWDSTIYHKDLLPVVFVTGDMAGRLDSPLYGMFSLVSQIDQGAAGGPGAHPAIRQPSRRLGRFQHQVGRRMDHHLRDLPRHGPRLRRGPGVHLSAGRRAVPLLRGAADHHGADPADHHRRHAGTCPARRQFHRDLHDRHDRPRRHHRAQFDLAGRFHQPGDCRRAAARRGRDPRREHPRASRSSSPGSRP